MNWNLFWGIDCIIFALVCWISAYFFGLKKLRLSKNCSSHTEGRVVRYSSINYSGIHIPLVEYTVDNKTYKIAGPRFLGAVVKTVSTPFGNPITPFESNLTTRENLPKKLQVKMYKNSFASGTLSPLSKLYPIDSKVDVYYNQRKPKEAFVQRHEGINKWIVGLFLFLAIVLTIVGIMIIVGPKIVM